MVNSQSAQSVTGINSDPVCRSILQRESNGFCEDEFFLSREINLLIDYTY